MLSGVGLSVVPHQKRFAAAKVCVYSLDWGVAVSVEGRLRCMAYYWVGCLLLQSVDLEHVRFPTLTVQ